MEAISSCRKVLRLSQGILVLGPQGISTLWKDSLEFSKSFSCSGVCGLGVVWARISEHLPGTCARFCLSLRRALSLSTALVFRNIQMLRRQRVDTCDLAPHQRGTDTLAWSNTSLPRGPTAGCCPGQSCV